MWWEMVSEKSSLFMSFHLLFSVSSFPLFSHPCSLSIFIHFLFILFSLIHPLQFHSSLVDEDTRMKSQYLEKEGDGNNDSWSEANKSNGSRNMLKDLFISILIPSLCYSSHPLSLSLLRTKEAREKIHQRNIY